MVAEFADAINVTREIYRPALRPVIEAALDRVAADADADAGAGLS